VTEAHQGKGGAGKKQHLPPIIPLAGVKSARGSHVPAQGCSWSISRSNGIEANTVVTIKFDMEKI
jgi:hypothetical protein